MPKKTHAIPQAKGQTGACFVSKGTIMYTVQDNDDVDRIEAKDATGKCIGYFEFIEEDQISPYTPPHLKLIDMHVDNDHQRKGIGTALMKHAVEKYGSFILPSRYFGSSDLRPEIYLTEDAGIPFIDYCFDKGILPKDKFFDEREAGRPDDVQEEEIEYTQTILPNAQI